MTTGKRYDPKEWRAGRTKKSDTPVGGQCCTWKRTGGTAGVDAVIHWEVFLHADIDRLRLRQASHHARLCAFSE